MLRTLRFTLVACSVMLVNVGTNAAGADDPGAIVGQIRSGVAPDQSEPLAGASILLFREGPDGLQFAGHTESGEEGHYEFAPIPPGGYLLIASAPEHLPRAKVAEVASGEPTVVHFLLHPVGPPEFGAVVGHVAGVNPDGEPMPLAGALLRLFHDGQLVREAETNDDGFYNMLEIPPGPYGLQASADGFQPQDMPVFVEPGQASKANFVLEPGGPPETGAVAGHVFGETPDGGEQPIPGALVFLFHGDEVIGDALTQDDGAFVFEDVPPGPYGLLATAKGFEPESAPVFVEPGQVTEQNFLLHPAGPMEFGAVAGHVFGVTPDGGEEPLPGAHLVLFHGDEVVGDALADEQGFYIIEGVPPGPYGLLALAEGFEPQNAPVFVEPNQVTEHDFLLHPAGPPEFGGVAGHVLGVTPDGGEAPLPGALVLLIHEDQVVGEGLTNEGGAYVIEEVPPGPYGLLAMAEGFAPEDAPVFVEPGQVTEQNFLLHPAGPPAFGGVAGHVFGVTPDGGEQPVADALLLLFHGGDNVVGEAVTDDTGFYAMEEVPAGPSVLLVLADGFEPQEVIVFVEPEQVTERNFVLHPIDPSQLGEIIGTVIGVFPDGGEEPLADALVVLLQGEQPVREVLTDESGAYAMDAVPAGEYGMLANAEGFQPSFAEVVVEPQQLTEQDFALLSLQGCDVCAFENVAPEVGLGDYVASTGDGHGPGGVFADLNNDGFPELYLLRAGGDDPSGDPAHAANQLYINVPVPNGGRRFELAPDGLGAGDTGNATGAVAGDYDNDGDLDLYVLNFDQPNALLQNQLVQNGLLQFIDVTAATDPTPGVPDNQFGVGMAMFENVPLDNSLTAAWSDVDRDGDLDLYVGNHNGWFGNPIEGPFPVPGRRDILYRNNGDGTFTDITLAAGVPGYVSENGTFQTPNQRFSSTNAVVFADFNNDGWPDLLVTNKTGGPTDRDMLYINLGREPGGAWQGFETATYQMPEPFGFASGAAMGVDVTDFDNDGDIDIYITDFSGAPGAPGLNDLWINQLSDSGVLSFVLSEGAPAEFSWGTQWQDFNNDGRVDLHVATSWLHRDYLYMNMAGGSTEAAIELGVAQDRNSRGDMAADYNRDGWVDLFVVNLDGGPSVLYENRFAAESENHYLQVRLVGDPALPGPFRSTPGAIGARVRVTADLNGDGVVGPNETQMREVVSGNSNAGSTSSLILEFGLGVATQAQVQVHWPSGRQTSLLLPADQFRTIVESEAGTGDFDGDGDVDLQDVAVYVGCLTGPGAPPPAPGCVLFDFDFDGDVDFGDFHVMQRVFTGETP